MTSHVPVKKMKSAKNVLPVESELLVGADVICQRFRISRARLKKWEEAGAPVYRRGFAHNAPCCADYHRLLDWESALYAPKPSGRKRSPCNKTP